MSHLYDDLPKSITIREEVVREGFQAIEKFIPTEAKLFLVNAIEEAGFRQIEISDYSDVAAVPQFRDRDDVFKRIERKPGVEYISIAHNTKAVERAVEAKKGGYGPDMVEMVVATSEPRHKAHFGMTLAEWWKEFEDCIKLTRDADMEIAVAIVTIWTCAFTGRVDPDTACQFVDRLANMGCKRICHSDPYGDVTPPEVFDYFSKVLSQHPEIEHSFHIHDWRGFGLAGYVAAMQAGVKVFETTMGGIGGWFADIVGGVPSSRSPEYRVKPGRTGLVSTEDFVVMCDAMGIDTGVDVDKVLNIGKWVEKMVDRRLYSYSLPWGKVTKAAHGIRV